MTTVRPGSPESLALCRAARSFVARRRALRLAIVALVFAGAAISLAACGSAPVAPIQPRYVPPPTWPPAAKSCGAGKCGASWVNDCPGLEPFSARECRR